MVRAAQPEPVVHEGVDAGVGAEVEVVHLDVRQLGRVEHLPTPDHQPVVLALERDERGGRGDAGLGREHRRRRIRQPSDPELAVDQLDRPVLARDLPVALPHVADQHRVELPVHRVHLAEVSISDQRLRGTHQRRRVRVALGGIPVPVPSRRIEQYPSQLQLEQASRDAADRLLSRFHVTPPQN